MFFLCHLTCWLSSIYRKQYEHYKDLCSYVFKVKLECCIKKKNPALPEWIPIKRTIN